jgi:Ca2+-transporting ATPase
MILWMNLVTDGLPALALGVDPKRDDVLDRPPRDRDAAVIDARLVGSVLATGLFMTVVGLWLFFGALDRTGSLPFAQTLLFTFLVLAELARAYLVRRHHGLRVTSNRWLAGAVATSFALQLAVLYTPLSAVFRVVALDLADWGLLAAATAVFVVLSLALSALVQRVAPRSATH